MSSPDDPQRLASLTDDTREKDQNMCGCGTCAQDQLHSSDCAVHNEPAMPVGPCDCCCEVCGAVPAVLRAKFPLVTMRYCKAPECVTDMLRSIEALR